MMPNSAHLHLLVNHFPVIGYFIIIVFLVYGIIFKQEKVKQFSMFMIVVLSLITILVFVSGNNAEGMVKGAEGAIEENIEVHQYAAVRSFIAMEILGGISLLMILYYRFKKPVPLSVTLIYLFLNLFVLWMMIYTSNLGGKIFHSEFM
ncbi:MAG TPA: hypothetical protein PK447_06045 [Ignavibacteria bacterium]|nr:hypothetical protein [Ignavibacteria bacterium]